ncbi:hypothetical protein ONE63_011386 [Megalurothrips usitatus]|uniref:Uncharacterized protein n=1 Tax=Megalurothrips usitatus TaxID=439358 RepID=A0AAV7X1Z7_9NEOP|nr:hypothetical protein ONE63_011386 [Megalurothrips usitatus]
MTQNLSYVSPEAVSIDNDKIDGASVYLIRPRRALKLLLEDKSVQKEVLESFGYESTPNIYSDYKDGKVYKNRPSCNEEKIDLIFASDACTVTSHVKGSAKNKYKINCSYFTLGNLKPHLRSKLDSIHLALLFRDDLLGDRVNYGVAKCFKPLLDDLKELEKTGIEFMGRTIKVAVQFFVCDSLGAHQLGGFIGNFTHTYFCRFCEITKQTFHLFPATVLPFRTAQEYLSALVELEERQKTKPDQVTHRGVKEFSPLNELREFHVVDPSLPPCLAHDLFEGVVDYDMTVIISKLVEAGWLSYESLNRLIKHFKCVGADAHNKPADAVCETKLSGHAVQNWTLVRLLPFILEGKIQDPQNEHWQLYLSLKKVVEYSCSPSFNDADLEAFKTVLDGYMAKRSELIEDTPKPKHHFLMHYPSLIPLVGPLIFLFTLRFEAKHQFLKRVAKACKNFINLLYTLSHRHQVYLSYLRTGVIYPEGIGPTKICNKSVNDFEDNVKKVLDGLGRLDKHYISLEREGIIFRTGSYMMIDKRRDGLIKVIASVGGQVYLIMEEYEPLLWEEYGVHRILPTGAMKAVKISCLACPAFQSVYDFKDELCFSSKFFVPPA